MALQRSSVFESGMAATLELNGQAESYATRVEEVRGDVLVVATPMKQREYLAIGQGQRILLQVLRRNSPYFFETAAVGTEWDEGKQLTLLRRPADSSGVTLRRHVRVAVTISDAQYWVEDEDGKFGATIPGSVLDISAGGLLAMTKEPLPESTVALSKFTLSKQAGTLMASLKVLRTFERVSDLGVKTFRSNCEFVDLPERERDRMIKFVFQRERELRAKSLI